jgi:hypothetical protein
MENRIIYFLTANEPKLPIRQFVSHYHFHTKQDIENKDIREVYTTNLEFLCFDLLDDFKEIYLYHEGSYYNLKLGSNNWTNKFLRKEHNLLKIVRASILS